MAFPFLITFFSIANLWAIDTTRSGEADNLVNLPPSGYQFLNIAEHVSLESFEGSIQGYVLGCEDDRNGRIGFCGSSCDEAPSSQGATISRECADFLDQHISQCILEFGCVNEVNFCGVGGHAQRSINTPGGGASTPSRHSTGDALDLFGLRCKDAHGRPLNLDFSQAGRARDPARYDAFTNCWRNKVEQFNSRQGGSGCGGAIACEGAPPPNNSLHNDHLHFSCPVQRKNVACI